MAMPVIRPQLNRLIETSITLAATLEDLPYTDNRVMAGRGGRAKILLQYRIHADDRRRLAIFRKLMKEVLRPLSYRVLPQADSNERIAHACGTCRFGDDPRTSVLNRNCRAHGLDNLYVVDSSFFPTSGGTNPGLTIAANALRVAEHLVGNTTGTYSDHVKASDRTTGPAYDDT
jgi:choline dehydrogenase-like flavoprotein